VKEFKDGLLEERMFYPDSVIARYRLIDLENDRPLEEMHAVKVNEDKYFLHIRYVFEESKDVIRSYEYDNLDIDFDIEFIEALNDKAIPKQEPIVETVRLENDTFNVVGFVDTMNRLHELMLNRNYDFRNDFFIRLVKAIAVCEGESEMIMVDKEISDGETTYFCVQKKEGVVDFRVVQ
jgi:hypothetical protein